MFLLFCYFFRGQLQLVSEQLHLAQRGMLHVSSTQTEPPQSFNVNNNRHQIRTHPQLLDKMDNNDSSSATHRTVLRLMDDSTIVNSIETPNYMEQSVNPSSICHLNEMSANTINAALITKNNPIDQIQQVHSSLDFHAAKTLTNFDDNTNQTIMSPATPAESGSAGVCTPASICSTIGSIKFTSASE